MDTAVISTHSAREDGDKNRYVIILTNSISTHSAREDGDDAEHNMDDDAYLISTHSAREDGDVM